MPMFEKVKKALKRASEHIGASMQGIAQRRARTFEFKIEEESLNELMGYFDEKELKKLDHFFSDNPHHPLRDAFIYFEASFLEERPKIVEKLRNLLSEINGMPPHFRFRTIERAKKEPIIVDPHPFRGIIEEMGIWKKPIEEQIFTLINLAQGIHKSENKNIYEAEEHLHKTATLSALLEAAEIEHEIEQDTDGKNTYIHIPMVKEDINISFDKKNEVDIAINKMDKTHKWSIVGGKVKYFKKGEMEDLRYSREFLDGLNALLLSKALKKKRF